MVCAFIALSPQKTCVPTAHMSYEIVGTALFLGAFYFAIIFAVAFAAGTLRTLIVAPAIGATAAVLLEVPIIIVVSWGVARTLLRHRPLGAGRRAQMGLAAFSLLMLAECTLANAMFDQSPGVWATTLLTPLGLLGFAGQVIFGLMPLLVRRSTV